MIAGAPLAGIPRALRDPLLLEYESIVQNYAEHRWSPSELSGGRFCEVVYTVLDGHAKQAYAAAPAKPTNFPAACKALEQNGHAPRSFQILIPRLLPALYEVRNNRGVGHVGGDVDPNHMDATFVVTSCNWIMAELVRVYHNVTTAEAQDVVDSLVERRIPLIWEGGDIRRVLDPSLTLKQQILVLLSTSIREVATADLLRWTDYHNRKYFMRLLREMHQARLIELSVEGLMARILPPGNAAAAEIVQRKVPK
jgi:hypothetical protein